MLPRRPGVQKQSLTGFHHAIVTSLRTNTTEAAEVTYGSDLARVGWIPMTGPREMEGDVDAGCASPVQRREVDRGKIGA